ncbi:ABC transporter substrate-binding protein [Undibacterium sp.]|uniref:ABC transporter substrate-binding protein n=1 Tax=Undibacterium sp. TaxID=1914977 RepID=UPI00374C95A0
MSRLMKTLATLTAGLALSASLISPAAAQANDQFVSILSFRVGPYGPSGVGIYGGFIDYMQYINMKEGGIGGIKFSWEECETEYQAAKGVECYERLKTKSPTKGSIIHPVSTPISYALLDKTVADKVPLVMTGYGRTDTVDGRYFPWAFPLITTYPMQATAIVKYIAQKEKGNLRGKKITYLYLDSAYGKEPITYLQAEAKVNGFELNTVPIAPPGNEQGAQWQQVRQNKADWVIFWGFGVMNQTALKAAQKVGYPRDKMIGSWWAGSEEDTVPAGEAAKGYLSAAMNVSGKNVPIVADIEKVVYGAGKGNLQDKSKIGSINHNRGIVIGILTAEAVRVGQKKYGKKVLSGEELRWALEHLDLSDARLKELGATGLMPAVKTSCLDHEGSGKIKIQQWDGAKWNVVSDWIDGNRQLVRPLLEESAKQYGKEKNITPRDCSKEQ